jgi:hypothetical protein
MNGLLKNADISYGGALVSNANNTDSNSTIVDMAGFDGCLFFTTITDSAATGVATLTVEGNTANSDSGMAALTGASAAKTCTVNDDINGTLLIVDVFKPVKRYLQGVRTSATANIAFGEIHCIRYKAANRPVTQGATVSTSTAVVGV